MGICKSKQINNHDDYIVQAMMNNEGQVLKIYRENSNDFTEFTVGLDKTLVENIYFKQLSLINVTPNADGVVDDCCICLEPMNSGVVCLNVCDHIFHRKCIQKQLDVKEICPLCRAENDMSKINEIKNNWPELRNQDPDSDLESTYSYSSDYSYGNDDY